MSSVIKAVFAPMLSPDLSVHGQYLINSILFRWVLSSRMLMPQCYHLINANWCCHGWWQQK